MNTFIDYLNSTNNISGDPTGSLAEKQVKSPYFDKIKVKRNLGSHIAQSVTSKEYKAFILTGHAGDGKTSILAQTLQELGLLNIVDGLSEEESFPDFYYVKDMSEIPENRQADILETVLTAPDNQKSSLLISNTGPLLKTFLTVIASAYQAAGKEFTQDDRLRIHSKLLTQLDKNEHKPITVENYTFTLVNIARVDNVHFSEEILTKILNPALWTPCKECSKHKTCPIYNNQQFVSNHLQEVLCFISNYYRFLFENDRRMTIRQMVGQLSYAITGNLTCKDVQSKVLKTPLFTYNFANLFFGYIGLKPNANCQQIKGIEQIQRLDLDGISLNVDYDLFVKNDYSFFHPEIADMLKKIHLQSKRNYRTLDISVDFRQKVDKKERDFRRSVRRFFLMYHLVQNPAQRDEVLNQIFGTNFSSYRDLTATHCTKARLKDMREMIFRALYIKNTGFLPIDQTKLPLTLRRDNDSYQSVMLVLGEIEKNDIEVIQEPASGVFDDCNTKQRLTLKIKGKLFPLTYPLIAYFQQLLRGDISCDNNPSLTHGIAALDALLIEQFKYRTPQEDEECDLAVLINTTQGQKIQRYSIEENELSIH